MPADVELFFLMFPRDIVRTRVGNKSMVAENTTSEHADNLHNSILLSNAIRSRYPFIVHCDGHTVSSMRAEPLMLPLKDHVSDLQDHPSRNLAPLHLIKHAGKLPREYTQNLWREKEFVRTSRVLPAVGGCNDSLPFLSQQALTPQSHLGETCTR